MALVPQVVDAVKIPVIAAGGIADGRGVAAAFMLGAVGVQVGDALPRGGRGAPSPRSTRRWSSQGQRHRHARHGSLDRPPGPRPQEPVLQQVRPDGVLGCAPRRSSTPLAPAPCARLPRRGDYENGSFLCGQIAGMVHERQSALEIVDDLVNGAEKVLGRSHAMGKVAFLFAGQGAQHPGMCADLIEAEPAGQGRLRRGRRGAPRYHRAVPLRHQGGAGADHQHPALRLRRRPRPAPARSPLAA